jgi:hypothetical protein
VLGVDHEHHAEVPLELDMVEDLVVKHHVVIFGLDLFKAPEVIPVHLAVVGLGAPWATAFCPVVEIAEIGIDAEFANLVSA